MKKQVLMVAISFVTVLTFGATSAMADELLPGANVPVDQSVMGVGKTMVEIGAKDRAITSALNSASRNVLHVNPNTGVDVYQQFGSSQTDQSWKSAKTVEEAQVHGLVPGDCQGENSDNEYRKQMNQSREGFMKEVLVPNELCGDYHKTLK
ncbi:exported hypothetical protein [Nitrospina gracilis 3/211]|uniref:Uncharacterized protein n=1 Tax=Nitrospina gracilis (strain 3/211) TaxID=1266370 RepID=M1YMT2_NITG3|nr:MULTISPECIES: hypothetical protein [Nitrospina]MCF8724594.1 hypothetical protein [Nitrospina sp. Nb-3]CCQ91775.1 exported hypothetical protein [Nitrospina gracilis 3/211]